MNSKTLEFIQLVSDTIKFTKEGHFDKALALIPVLEQWIKDNASSVE